MTWPWKWIDWFKNIFKSIRSVLDVFFWSSLTSFFLFHGDSSKRQVLEDNFRRTTCRRQFLEDNFKKTVYKTIQKDNPNIRLSCFWGVSSYVYVLYPVKTFIKCEICIPNKMRSIVLAFECVANKIRYFWLDGNSSCSKLLLYKN